VNARIAGLALSGLVLAVVSSANNVETNRPPGVREMDWIAISDNFGIVSGPASPYSDRSKPTLSGKLMARRGSTWYHIDLATVEFRRAE
jgi:hypothetical protein